MERLLSREYRSTTAGNRVEIHFRRIFHVNVHTFTNEIIADVVHQKKVIALLCIVDHKIRMLRTIDQQFVVCSLFS